MQTNNTISEIGLLEPFKGWPQWLSRLVFVPCSCLLAYWIVFGIASLFGQFRGDMFNLETIGLFSLIGIPQSIWFLSQKENYSRKVFVAAALWGLLGGCLDGWLVKWSWSVVLFVLVPFIYILSLGLILGYVNSNLDIGRREVAKGRATSKRVG